MGLDLHAPFETIHESIDEADAGAFEDAGDGLLTNSITKDIPSLAQDFTKKPKTPSAVPGLEADSDMVVDNTISSIVPTLVGKKRRGKRKTVFATYTKTQEDKVVGLDQDIDKLKEEQ